MPSPEPSINPFQPEPATVGPAAEEPQLWTGANERCGRFVVVRPLAKGGLGEVVVAQDDELGREVALTRIQDRFTGDAGSRRRFLVEAAITAKLEHPGIVPIYGLVQDDHGQPCYAMRFIQGESLLEAIKRWHGAPARPAAMACP